MNYVDGFVIAVPTANKEAFRKMAAEIAPVFREHGALKVVECWGDDVPDGKTTDFKRAVKAEPDETVVFSWVVWPSKEIRDAGNKRIMEDPRMQSPDMSIFDGRRMIFGGFQTIVET
ncbi:DUF1428 domain-containing protein [Propylenella binzhouense]|uniref:DUF1428 domain-containing protein n=1 Tax=Propylenella binzhouense TaxID=2555902 RepID=A0A964T534_9HYPH|nr:DUF1428 domain-containing protein [Propylenella binzhouense]MYZ48519.1 DUF1428 domain-containing protein [Propylenella binzhouense]